MRFTWLLFMASDGSQAEHTGEPENVVLKVQFPSLFESPDGEMTPKLKCSNIHYCYLDYELSLKSIMNINQHRGCRLYTELWPLPLSFCTEKQMALQLPTHWWEPSPSSHRNILTKLQVACLNYCFLVPWILQWKIHKKTWEAGRSSPFLISLQASLSLYTSERGDRPCLPY